MTQPTVPNVLSVAGSDPSGGAGIQADLKTFAALGAYGMAALTALTAQNTRGVTAIHSLPPDFLRQQIDTVFADIEVAAVKVGMVGRADAVAAVGDCLAAHRPACIVVDPVMVAKSGDRLIDDDAVAALRERLLPQASVITPNLPEAAVLLGDAETARDGGGMVAVAERLQRLTGGAVLLKGGHLPGAESPDLLLHAGTVQWIPGRRVETGSTHGTGCTLSSAIAALVPQCPDLGTAVHGAKSYLLEALAGAGALSVGGGHGPLHHFHALWRCLERA